MKSAVILLAQGFEEVEAVTPIDFLRRAGIQVKTLAVGGQRMVEGGHSIVIRADGLIEDFTGIADIVVLPGGGIGSQNLAGSKVVAELILSFQAQGRLVSAICAAPAVVLFPLGLLEGRRFTCYPGMEAQVSAAQFSPERVVRDGQLITSRGAGTAAEFSLAIIASLLGEAAAQEIHRSTVQPD